MAVGVLARSYNIAHVLGALMHRVLSRESKLLNKQRVSSPKGLVVVIAYAVVDQCMIIEGGNALRMTSKVKGLAHARLYITVVDGTVTLPALLHAHIGYSVA